MSQPIDETGNRYGKLLVIKKAKVQNGAYYWQCRCDCGKKIVVIGNALRSGNSRSCGCCRGLGPYLIDETGNRYGKLLVIKRAKVPEGVRSHWQCRCDCGKKTVVRGNSLRSGRSRSCGCSRKIGRYIDETGNHYGRLLVIERVERPKHLKNARVYWLCDCICGNTTVVSGDVLRSGRTVSCGCYHRRIPIPRTRRHKLRKEVPIAKTRRPKLGKEVPIAKTRRPKLGQLARKVKKVSQTQKAR